MITGAHLLFYSEKPDDDRAFFRDVLGFPSVDIGGGWLIFGLPPAEAAFHPVDEKEGGEGSQRPHAGPRLLGAELYLMCDDLSAYMKLLEARNVECAPVHEERWGIVTTIPLPSGGAIGLYQPKHPTALGLGAT